MRILRHILFALALVPVILHAQIPAPVSGDVTVRLSEPIDFATARPLQAVRCTVTGSTNPAVPIGSNAVLQLQNRDGSYTVKLMRIVVPGTVFKTMSQGGVAVSGPPASGAHASLAAGALVRFTLTQQDGSPGPDLSKAAAASNSTQQASPTAQRPASSALEANYPFTIDGIGLRMTLEQVRASAKADGSVKGPQKQGPTTYNLDTRDLYFQIEFTPDMHVSQYNVSSRNPRHLKETEKSGPLYDKLVKAFGGQATWGNAVLYDPGEGGGTAFAIVHDESAR